MFMDAAERVQKCAGVVPLALICGPIRGIPFWWSLIDISFGVFGVIPLLVLRRAIKRLEAVPATPRGRLTGATRRGGYPAKAAITMPRATGFISRPLASVEFTEYTRVRDRSRVPPITVL